MSEFNPDDWDSHWSLNDSAASLNPAQEYRHSAVANILDQIECESLVDIGCGQGDFLQFFSLKNPDIKLRGVELSSVGAEITRQKAPNADIVQADILSDEFNCKLLKVSDVGTCIEVLEHLDDPEFFLKKSFDLINPGGKLIVTVPSGPRTAFDKHIGHRKHYTPTTLTTLLKQSGYESVIVKRYGWPFFNLYRLMVLIRGRKLIVDVEKKSIADSNAAKLFAKIFTKAFKVNVSNKYFGWQLIAVCTKPSGYADSGK